jgi:aspartyl-tRNA(Asn)/glutamyl-tRNA(Gln) amidotransferase subunit C
MAKIDKAEVARIALLSRLDLDAAALDSMTSHLANVLELVAALDKYDTKAVSARVHGGDAALVPPLRPDVIRPSLSPDEALAMAPEKGKDGFKVPGVVDREEG